jgi:hypothetical protein
VSIVRRPVLFDPLTPGSTLKLMLFTNTSPFGLISGTWSNRISSDSMILPRPSSTGRELVAAGAESSAHSSCCLRRWTS